MTLLYNRKTERRNTPAEVAYVVPQADPTVVEPEPVDVADVEPASVEPPTFLESLQSLEPIGLDTLMDQALLQTRIDRKYLVPTDVIAHVVSDLSSNLNALEMDDTRLFRYLSVYFDTDDLLCFRRQVQGRRRQFKVRMRSYLDSGECQLEVKMKGNREETVKSRMPYQADESYLLNDEGRAFIDGIVGDPEAVARLRPVLISHYRRATLIDLDAQTRLTCDVELEWLTENGHSGKPPDDVLVETKTLGPLGDADRLLRSYGHRPISISKYGIGIAMLNPEMPANPWHRIICQHFPQARPDVTAR